MLTGERVWETPWPDADLSLLERDVVEIVVQVNGKLRDRVQAPATASREELEALARERPNVHRAHRRQAGREGRSSCRPSWSTSSCADARASAVAIVARLARIASRARTFVALPRDIGTERDRHVTRSRLGSAACSDRDPRRLAAWAAAALVLSLLAALVPRPLAAGGGRRAAAAVAAIAIDVERATTAAARVDRRRRGRGQAPGRLPADVAASASRTRSSAPAAPTRRADLSQINRAAKLEDGRQILVPARASQGRAPHGRAGDAPRPGRADPAGNLNTATLEQLDTLDGVGPATAQKILDYRTSTAGSARSTSSTRSRASARSASRPCASTSGSERVRDAAPSPGAHGASARTRATSCWRALVAGLLLAPHGVPARRPRRRARRRRARPAARGVAAAAPASRSLVRRRGVRRRAPGRASTPASSPRCTAARGRDPRGRARTGPRAAAFGRRRARPASSTAPGRASRPCSASGRARGRGAWPEVGDIVARPRHGRAARVRGRLSAAAQRPRRDRRRTRVTRPGERRGGSRARSTASGAARSAGWRRARSRPRRRCCAGWCSARTSASTDDVRDDFQRSGLAHILAVSGQNVCCLIALVLAAVRARRASPLRRAAGARRRRDRALRPARRAADRRSSAPG